ncbi:hypothetical protein M0R45_014975 [Rubus argutus]|uniref:Uncharacterized protein n=1 Tax=Rubus argutus TaxID=59490 RepID=A0AAW1XP49_RUBAR
MPKHRRALSSPAPASARLNQPPTPQSRPQPLCPVDHQIELVLSRPATPSSSTVAPPHKLHCRSPFTTTTANSPPSPASPSRARAPLTLSRHLPSMN